MTRQKTFAASELPLPIHDIAMMLPELPAQQYRQLVDSIRESGLQQRVIVFDGKVIDGRHRMKACVELGIPMLATVITDTSTEALLAISIGNNVARRHLNESQRALIGAGMVNSRRGVSAGEFTVTQSRAAEMVSVSERYLRDACWLMANGEDLFETVLRGDMSLRSACNATRAALGIQSQPARERPVLVPQFPPVAATEQTASSTSVTSTVQQIVEGNIDPAAWVRSLDRANALAITRALENFARAAYDIVDEEQDTSRPVTVDAEDRDSHRNIIVERGGSRVGGARIVEAEPARPAEPAPVPVSRTVSRRRRGTPAAAANYLEALDQAVEVGEAVEARRGNGEVPF